MSNKLRLMAEYGGTVLWGVDPDDPGPIEPDALPITSELKHAIRAWADTYDRTLNQDYPPDSGFTELEEQQAFEAEGKRLWEELQSQLGHDWDVFYHSESDHKQGSGTFTKGGSCVLTTQRNNIIHSLNHNALNHNEIHIPGFEVAWVGESNTEPVICLGSEDGRITFERMGLREYSEPESFAESGEAINGVAFSGEYLAVSTPSEVEFWQIGGAANGSFQYEGGAHGIISTASGLFVAPLGIRGLLSVRPEPGDFHAINTLKHEGKTLDFYQAVSLGSNEIGDVIACATRHDGLATVVHGVVSDSTISTLTYPGLDVVDVCSLGSQEFPLAVAVLGIDRSVYLIRDVLRDRHPQTLRIPGLRGTAYRILQSQGHVMLLTSECLYTFKGLASRFLAGDRISGKICCGSIDVQAVDASIVFDRWLLVVLPEGYAVSVEVEQLAAVNIDSSTGESPQRFPGMDACGESSVNSDSSTGESPQAIEPKWELSSQRALVCAAA